RAAQPIPCLSPGVLTLPTAAVAPPAPPTPGSPLSDREYREFFVKLQPPWQASMFCLLRQAYGCLSPTVLHLDREENRGEIPEGPVCSEFPEMKQFQTFCQFAQYRCLKQQFFIKKQLFCPCPCPAAGQCRRPSQALCALLGQKPPPREHPTATATPKAPTPWQKSRTTHAAVRASTSPSRTESPEEQSLRKSIWHLIHSALSMDASLDNKNSSQNSTSSGPGHTSEQEIPPQGSPSHMPPKAQQPLCSLCVTQARTDPAGSPIPLCSLAKIQGFFGKGFFALFWGCFQFLTKDASLQFVKRNEMTPSFPFLASLLALQNDEAVLILCYAVLEGNCLSSMLTMAWKEMEKRVIGFGDLVCDSFGRHHEDLCPDCAFCSLKREQCQNIETLNRVHCDSGSFSTYINPQISAQHNKIEGKSRSPQTMEHYNLDFLRGMRMEYWCSQMAVYSCRDPAVTLWLKAEYDAFQDNDGSGKICDSSGVQHPNYCMFKSYQCLRKSIYNQRVTRVQCKQDKAYRVLSVKEGDKEVKLWQEKFQSLSGQ
ncbi:ACRBP protein, partial [Erithacus rubecula]|nr:ACRBP protein [Erithacus rubecula]